MVNGNIPPIKENLFMIQENVHNIRNFHAIFNKNIKTVSYILEAIYHKTPFLWANLLVDIKLTSDFKTNIKIENATTMFVVCVGLSNRA